MAPGSSKHLPENSSGALGQVKSAKSSLLWGKWPPHSVLKHPNRLRRNALYCFASSLPVGSLGPRFLLLCIGSLFSHSSSWKDNTRHCVESLTPEYLKRPPLPICGSQTPPLQPRTSSYGASGDNNERFSVGKGQSTAGNPQTAVLLGA